MKILWRQARTAWSDPAIYSVSVFPAGLALWMRALKINGKRTVKKQFPVGFGCFATAQQ